MPRTNWKLITFKTLINVFTFQPTCILVCVGSMLFKDYSILQLLLRQQRFSAFVLLCKEEKKCGDADV